MAMKDGWVDQTNLNLNVSQLYLISVVAYVSYYMIIFDVYNFTRSYAQFLFALGFSCPLGFKTLPVSILYVTFLFFS